MAIPTVPKAMKRSSPNLFGAHRYTIYDGMCALRGPLHGALSARGQPNGAPTVPRPVQRTHLPLRMLRPHNSHVSHGCYSDEAFRHTPPRCDGSPPHIERQVM